MSGGRLTIWIDGREALPVRAIPYVTKLGTLSPDVVVNSLARRVIQPPPWQPELRGLTAYRLLEGGSVLIKPCEWERTTANLDGLRKELQEKRPGVSLDDDDEGYAEWCRTAAKWILPGVFVWLEEFEAERDIDRGEAPLHPSNHYELTLSPMLDDADSQMIREGFPPGACQQSNTDVSRSHPGGPRQVGAGATAKAKGGRKQGPARELLIRILDELEKWAAVAGEPFDRRRMPGQVGKGPDDAPGFHWFCAEIDGHVFRRAKATFEKHRDGLCTFAGWAKASDFYRRALPHIAPKFASGNKAAKLPVGKRKAA